jgi:hypothetical protein
VGVDIWDELLVVNLLNGKEVHVHFFDWRLGVIVAVSMLKFKKRTLLHI